MNGHVNGHVALSPEIFVRMVNTFTAHKNDVLSVAWTGNIVASGSADKSIRVWRIADRSSNQVELQECPYSPITDHTFHVQSLHFSAFGNYLADCSSDGVVMVWDTSSGMRVASTNYADPDHSGPQHQTALRCCRMSLDSKLVAAGGDGDSVALWNFDKLSGLQLLRIFYGHENTVTCLAFTHDGDFVFSGSVSGDIRMWDCRGPRDQAVTICRDCHDLGVTCMDIAPYKINTNFGETAYQLATGGYDNTIKLWHVVERRGSHPKIIHSSTLQGHSADVCSVRFANQSKLLISCSSDRTMVLWDPIKCRALKRVGPLTKYARSCCFSSDDRFIMAGFSGGIIGFWQISSENDDLSKVSITVIKRSEMQPYDFLEEANAPDEFFCPITQEIMKDPVIAMDGASYERSAISAWLKSHGTSPKTNLPLASQDLIPNVNLRQLIERWKEKNATSRRNS